MHDEFDSDGIEDYNNELVAALDKHEYGPNQKYELDMKNARSPEDHLLRRHQNWSLRLYHSGMYT
ncbi:hypothetical protein H5410_061969 [Solanum commersonii]|uniref:Uncharacterized protein n=1 Tax=Solanum commersonii TaxID=4109 RepID=A0A9J5W953_SOLCO|nr:hypothetical protein H5410_061969 [Solanum commersonii]